MKNWRTHKKHQCLYTSFPVQFMWTVLWKYHSYSSKSFVIFFSSEMLQGPQSGSYYSEWCCTWNTLEVPIVYLEIVNMQSHYNYYCVFSIVLFSQLPVFDLLSSIGKLVWVEGATILLRIQIGKKSLTS